MVFRATTAGSLRLANVTRFSWRKPSICAKGITNVRRSPNVLFDIYSTSVAPCIPKIRLPLTTAKCLVPKQTPCLNLYYQDKFFVEVSLMNFVSM